MVQRNRNRSIALLLLGGFLFFIPSFAVIVLQQFVDLGAQGTFIIGLSSVLSGIVFIVMGLRRF